MMKFVLMLALIIWTIYSASMLGIDFFYEKYTNLKRYHIGHFQSAKDWENRVRRCAVIWLAKTPTVRKEERVSHVLSDFLSGENSDAAIQSWQQAGLLLGLGVGNSEEERKAVRSWHLDAFRQNGTWKKFVKKVDFAMLGYAALQTAEDTRLIKPAMDEIINCLNENRCADGMISYSMGQETSVRFVDTLGMVCPFLACYARCYGATEYALLAFEQINLFRKDGMWNITALPCHAYDASQKLPLGVYGWGRGCAWYFLALVDTWKEMPESKEKDELREWIKEAADDYIKYQREDGGFAVIMQEGNQYDSSVTAAMAYLYGECAYIFEESDYAMVSSKCIRKLTTVTMRDGAVDQCQGDTHGIGIFSQIFDIMPFSQGMLLRAINMEENRK